MTISFCRFANYLAKRNEVLGLKGGAKRGLRFPKGQITPDGSRLPELPRLFEYLAAIPGRVTGFSFSITLS